jgi:hypothetical protein
MPRTKKSPYRPKWGIEVAKNYSDEEIMEIADKMLEWINSPGPEGKPANFWLNDFAISNKLTPRQLIQFSAKNDYFNSIYEICRLVQESKLLKMALYKEVNATPAVFILKSIIGSAENNKPADMDSAKQQIEEMFE